MMGKIILIILLCFLVRSIDAQEFKVHSFRCLPNDITAWIDPVRDLNDEACALIKVVGDPDFVFSTPLGIVSRKNEVGEIWLYVPHGTVKLTIKHPRWGVLRDYRFPAALESRLTYELVIASPPEKVQEKPGGAETSVPGTEKHFVGLFASSRVRGKVAGRKAGLFSLGNLGVTRGGGRERVEVWDHEAAWRVVARAE